MYTIQVFKVGESMVPGPEIYWQQHNGKWYQLGFFIWLIRGQGRTLLIDTGQEPDVSWLNDWMNRWKGPEAYWITTDVPVSCLARVGVQPEDVEHVILSSLGPYAAANCHRFPRAHFWISRTGWNEYFDPKYPFFRYPINPQAMAYLTTEALERLHLVEGEAEVVPGIRVWETGCHHRHSQAISIETAKGKAIMADSVFYFDNIEQNVYLGICQNVFECIDLWDRIRREAAIVLPSHDPAILQRYPNGIIP